MKLPLSDEVRMLRQRLNLAQDATLHLARVRAALTSLDVVERHAPQSPDDARPLPGDAVLTTLAETWPGLADLASVGTPGTASRSDRLAARRAQLRLSCQTLMPISNELAALGQELSRLQHQQQHELEAPEWADVVRQLSALAVQRDQLQHEVHPLKQRHSVLVPTLRTLNTFLVRIDHELTTAKGEYDPKGHLAWRAATIVDTVVHSLDSLLREVDLEIPFPDPPGAPDAPDPARAEALWVSIEQSRVLLGELSVLLQAQCEALDAQVSKLAAEQQHLNSLMLERMG